MMFHLIHADHAHLTGDAQKAKFHRQQIINTYEQHPKMKEDESLRYLNSLNNYLASCFQLNDFCFLECLCLCLWQPQCPPEIIDNCFESNSAKGFSFNITFDSFEKFIFRCIIKIFDAYSNNAFRLTQFFFI